MSREEENFMVSLLCDGSIESFSDLFYLSHRALSPGESPETLEVLKDVGQTLAEGERFRASDETEKVIGTLCSIGKRYLDVDKAGCAIMFFTRALEMSRGISNTASELACIHDLGRCEDKRGDYVASSAYFESEKSLAERVGNSEAVLSALTQLVGVRRKQAAEMEAKSGAESSLKFLLLGLTATQLCKDTVSEAKFSYEVGRVCTLCEKAEEGIPHLKNYVSIAQT